PARSCLISRRRQAEMARRTSTKSRWETTALLISRRTRARSVAARSPDAGSCPVAAERSIEPPSRPKSVYQRKSVRRIFLPSTSGSAPHEKFLRRIYGPNTISGDRGSCGASLFLRYLIGTTSQPKYLMTAAPQVQTNPEERSTCLPLE